MSEDNSNKQTEIKQEQKQETVVKSDSRQETVDSFSNNLIIENQRKMVLQIEALEKKLNEAKKNEERTLNLLREREAADKARIQGELVNRALSDFPVIGNAREVAVNMIKSKLSFDDQQQPLWEGKQVDEAGLKGGLDTFFKDNSFLLDKSVKTTTPIQSNVKPQQGTQTQQYDITTVEGMNAFLRSKHGVKK